MPYSSYTINGYGGLNEDENPAALRPDQLREATNVCRLGNLTGTRPGLVADSEYADPVTSAPAVQGVHEFRSGRDENRSLVVVAGGDVFTDDTTTLTKSSATISSGAQNLWTFAHHQGQLWGAGGASGDSVWSWDGSGNVTGRLSSLFGGSNAKPQFVFEKFGVLHLGGFYDGTDPWNNPLVSRYSDFAADTTLATSWPNSNTIPGQLLGENSGVGSYGNEFHTGFGSYQDNKGDFLLFLTNRRILSFRENPSVQSNANRFAQTDAIANGCVGQRAFVDLGFDQGDAVFASEHGIHSMALSQQYGNRENEFLSWPIRKTWETLNRSMLNRMCGAYWPEEGLVTFAVATGSNTYLDTILCMDIKGVSQISSDTVRWYKWRTNGVNTNFLTAARDPDGVPRIYLGGAAGEVAPFSRSAYSDLGAAIPYAWRGKDEDQGLPSVEKAIGDTFLMVGGQGNYAPTMSYVVDDGRKTITTKTLTVALSGFVLDNSAGNLVGASTLDNTAGTLSGAGTLGSDFNLVRDRVVGFGSGFNLSHRFSHTGINEPLFIGQITQDIAADGISDEAA